MNTPREPTKSLHIGAAISASEVLRNITQQMALSKAYWGFVQDLIPIALRRHVQAGRVNPENHEWILMVNGPSAASKLKQLIPHMQEKIATQVGQPSKIVLKIKGS